MAPATRRIATRLRTRYPRVPDAVWARLELSPAHVGVAIGLMGGVMAASPLASAGAGQADSHCSTGRARTTAPDCPDPRRDREQPPPPAGQSYSRAESRIVDLEHFRSSRPAVVDLASVRSCRCVVGWRHAIRSNHTCQ